MPGWGENMSDWLATAAWLIGSVFAGVSAGLASIGNWPASSSAALVTLTGALVVVATLELKELSREARQKREAAERDELLAAMDWWIENAGKESEIDEAWAETKKLMYFARKNEHRRTIAAAIEQNPGWELAKSANEVLAWEWAD